MGTPMSLSKSGKEAGKMDFFFAQSISSLLEVHHFQAWLQKYVLQKIIPIVLI